MSLEFYLSKGLQLTNLIGNEHLIKSLLTNQKIKCPIMKEQQIRRNTKFLCETLSIYRLNSLIDTIINI